MQIFSIAALITFLWLCFGYSLAFAPSSNNNLTQQQIDSMIIYGNSENFWLLNIKLDSYHMNATTIPESVYCTFQLTFAIITAGLICGSVADRMKYFPFMLFIGLWHLLVYCPIAHTMWSPAGLFYQYGVLDFAGGNVVHISSGVSGLVAALFVGNRSGWKPREDTHPPFNTLLTFMGMCVLSLFTIHLLTHSLYTHSYSLRYEHALGWLVWLQCWLCYCCQWSSRIRDACNDDFHCCCLLILDVDSVHLHQKAWHLRYDQ